MFLNNTAQKLSLGAVALLTALFYTSPAQADEVWGSNYGNVVYQADREKTAILTYGDQSDGALFVEGLAGQTKNRGTYYGYWSQSSAKVRCETYREGRYGKPTYYWGNLRMQFLDPDFPFRWSAAIGYCNQPPKLDWRAYPIVGEVNPSTFELP
jgi:hypothetical protein